MNLCAVSAAAEAATSPCVGRCDRLGSVTRPARERARPCNRRSSMRSQALLTIFASAVTLVACGGSDSPSAPSVTTQSITVSSSSDLLHVGASETFTATATMSDAHSVIMYCMTCGVRCMPRVEGQGMSRCRPGSAAGLNHRSTYSRAPSKSVPAQRNPTWPSGRITYCAEPSTPSRASAS